MRKILFLVLFCVFALGLTSPKTDSSTEVTGPQSEPVILPCIPTYCSCWCMLNCLGITQSDIEFTACWNLCMIGCACPCHPI